MGYPEWDGRTETEVIEPLRREVERLRRENTALIGVIVSHDRYLVSMMGVQDDDAFTSASFHLYAKLADEGLLEVIGIEGK